MSAMAVSKRAALISGPTLATPRLSFALAADDLDVAGEDALPNQPDWQFVHSGLYGGYLGDGPDNGTLSQTVPTIAGQKLLVSFWLTSVSDDQGETTPNNFAANWNGSPLFSGTDLPAFGWTNMQYIVPSVGTSGKLEFDFNNTPGAFGIDDITVEPVPGPIIYSEAVTGGNVSFNWNALVNYSYQLQTATVPVPANWSNVGNTILATNPVVQVSLPIDNSKTRFYRVVMLLP